MCEHFLRRSDTCPLIAVREKDLVRRASGQVSTGIFILIFEMGLTRWHHNGRLCWLWLRCHQEQFQFSVNSYAGAERKATQTRRENMDLKPLRERCLRA